MSAEKTPEKPAAGSEGATPDPAAASDAPKTRLGRNYRRAKKVSDAYDNASTLWDIWNWIKTPVEAVVAAAKANTAATVAAAAVATTATVAVVEPELFTSLFEEDPPPAETRVVEERVETIRWGEAVVFQIDGADAEGRPARFDVAVLSTEFAWARASADLLTRNGTTLQADALETVVFAPPLRAGLAEAEALIAVGVASQEGDVLAETARARARAVTAAGWLGAYVSAEAPIYTLNLGQYQVSCGADASEGASWQRPVLFIGVREAAADVDLREALIDAMAGKSNLPDQACYSAFTLEAVATVAPPR